MLNINYSEIVNFRLLSVTFLEGVIIVISFFLFDLGIIRRLSAVLNQIWYLKIIVLLIQVSLLVVQGYSIIMQCSTPSVYMTRNNNFFLYKRKRNEMLKIYRRGIIFKLWQLYEHHHYFEYVDLFQLFWHLILTIKINLFFYITSIVLEILMFTTSHV